jgi:hypothetical protein
MKLTHKEFKRVHVMVSIMRLFYFIFYSITHSFHNRNPCAFSFQEDARLIMWRELPLSV